MKKWNEAKIEELNIEQTAHNWTGIFRDGGYVGDGEISGHLSWTPSNNGNSGNGNSGNGNSGTGEGTGEAEDTLS